MSKAAALLGDNLTPLKTTGMPKVTTIILDENDDIPPTGLFVGHNGRSFMIRPGYEVDVPDEVLEILDHAVGKVPVVDPMSKKVVDYRKRHRFPYRVIRHKQEPAAA